MTNNFERNEDKKFNTSLEEAWSGKAVCLIFDEGRGVIYHCETADIDFAAVLALLLAKDFDEQEEVIALEDDARMVNDVLFNNGSISVSQERLLTAMLSAIVIQTEKHIEEKSVLQMAWSIIGDLLEENFVGPVVVGFLVGNAREDDK